MGKDSLLESTSKKKAAAKGDKEKPAKKKAAAKKATSSKTTAKAKKAAAKKAAGNKKSDSPANKKAAKKVAAPKAAAKATKPAKKAPAPKKPAAKKLTRKELLWKKFEPLAAAARYAPPTKAKSATVADAPSFFSGMSDGEAKKAREYLKRKFDWAEIQAAGKKYAAEMAAKAEAEAKRKAEEEAKRKAEEEAKRKAEEEAKRKAEEEAKRKAEEEAKRKAEEEAKRKAEEEAKRKAEEEAKRKAEEEAKRKAEEEAKRKAEEEAKRKAEEEAQRKAEEQMTPPPAETGADAGKGFNPMKMGIIGFCAIIALLIFSSYSNTKNYYITEKDGAVEIWRGIFAPMGKTRLMILPGIQMPPEVKKTYGWQDAYRLMYQYYVEKADATLAVPGIPDTAALTQDLEKAIYYAPDREMRDAARARLVSIHMQTLIQKAQAAMNRGTVESAREAIDFLKEAAQYDLSEAEAEMVRRKIEEAESVLADREMAKAAAAKAAAEKKALEAEAQSLKEASQNEPPAAAEEAGH